MGYLLERSPVVHRCCGLPLRTAALVIALVGVAWAALYLVVFGSEGAGWVCAAAGRSDVTLALRYAHGALGVLLCALHALLLLAALYESDALCDVYVWGMLACWAGVLCAAIALTGAAVVAGKLVFAAATLFSMLLSLLVSFYFVIVVINYRLTIP